MHDPAKKVYDLLQFGEYGGVNPSITDSSTFTFMHADTMEGTFQGNQDGCFLYSRHWNPSNKYLSDAMAALEGTPAAWVTSSGMSAITCTLLQLCNSGDHIITSITTYGGTYAFLKNYLPKFNIEVSFVDITKIDSVIKAIKPNTKVIYTESITNPLLHVSDIPHLSEIAKANNITLVVDNTFCPMILTPYLLGAEIVVYSMTKFINGKNDCVAGAICASQEFIDSLVNVNSGSAMLLGPVLDSMRSSSILKNLHTLHLRMKQHSHNAYFIAHNFDEVGIKVSYPGMKNHPGHGLLKSMMNEEFGYGGLLIIDLGSHKKANQLMEKMEENGVGLLAVSLGYFKTLFSCSGQSTSSEIPEEVQRAMGLSEGIIRFSVGLDNNIHDSWVRIEQSLTQLGFI